jgi:hypothetical protein
MTELNNLISALTTTSVPENLQALVNEVPISDIGSFGSSGTTALFCACRNGAPECVATLLAVPGLDINKGDAATGRTPLHGNLFSPVNFFLKPFIFIRNFFIVNFLKPFNFIRNFFLTVTYFFF